MCNYFGKFHLFFWIAILNRNHSKFRMQTAPKWGNYFVRKNDDSNTLMDEPANSLMIDKFRHIAKISEPSLLRLVEEDENRPSVLWNNLPFLSYRGHPAPLECCTPPLQLLTTTTSTDVRVIMRSVTWKHVLFMLALW